MIYFIYCSIIFVDAAWVSRMPSFDSFIFAKFIIGKFGTKILQNSFWPVNSFRRHFYVESVAHDELL